MHKLLTYGLALGWLLGAAPAGAQAQAGARPRVGLTLSGGGARGLAHVGLLQALDSAGLAVDYVTGTSMGAVVGSLYSAGYTGRDIERIALGIDWGAVLSNNPPLALVPLPERAEYDRYVVQLPLGRHGVQLSGGLLESRRAVADV